MADIRITGRMVNFTRLTLDSADQEAIRSQLKQMLEDTGSYGAPIIIDSTVEQDLASIIELLLSLNVQPMAVVDGLLTEQARAIKMTVLAVDRPLQRIKPSQEQVVEINSETTAQPTVEIEQISTEATEPPPIPVIKHATSYHQEMLRTGQALTQDHGDIILNASMNSGSETIASGNIHIYGSVRGRVMAGASGNTAARIFCQSLDAELISIAGIYCLADDIPADLVRKAVHISLNDTQELVFEALEF